MIGEVVKNNEIIMGMQKQIVGLVVMEEKRWQEEREMEGRREKEQKEMDRWMEEYRKRNEKEKEEKEELRRVDEEWRRIENMRKEEEKRVEKEWRYLEMKERRREENRQRAMEERKCFGCERFGYMAKHCRKIGKEEPMPVSSNRFEVLKIRVM